MQKNQTDKTDSHVPIHKWHVHRALAEGEMTKIPAFVFVFFKSSFQFFF